MSDPVATVELDVAPTIAVLATLADKVQKRVLRKAATAGAQAAAKTAKRLAPKRVVHVHKQTDVAGDGKGQRAMKRYRKKQAVRRNLFGAIKSLFGPRARRLKSNYRGGLTKKALGYKVFVSRSRATVTAVVGARKGFATVIGRRQRKGRRNSAGTDIVADPKRYLHLVVKGTRRTKAKDFLTPAAADGARAAKAVLKREVDALASAYTPPVVQAS